MKKYYRINSLLSTWDPIGVGKPISDSEYTGYISLILKGYQNKNLEAVLLEILNNHLGLEVNALDENDMQLLSGMEKIFGESNEIKNEQ